MRSLTYAGMAIILVGAAIFCISIISGEGGMAIFLIFPVFYSTGILGAFGTFLIFIGFFLLFLSPFIGATMMEERIMIPPDFEQNRESKRKVRYGGVVFIGPIPIVFGSDKNYALYAMLGGFLLLFAIIVLFLLL